MTQNVKTIAVLRAHPGREVELLNLLKGMIAPSRAEAGNLGYDLWTQPAEPGVFVLDELYVDAAAREAHRASPHFEHYASSIGALGERLAFALEPVAVRA